MQYLTTKNIIQVIGKIWMPNSTCAMEYTLNKSDLEQYGIDLQNPTKESIERWISTNTGDFSSIEDFRADIGANKVIDWTNPESEYIFSDCMNPLED